MNLEDALKTQPELTRLQKVKKYFVDSTSMLAATNPIFQGVELYSGVSDDVSINIRVNAALWTYGILGYLVPKAREVSRKVFKVPYEGEEKKQVIHDSLFLAAINIPVGIGLFYASGERDWGVITQGVSLNTAIGLGIGSYMGWVIDVGQDLTGLKECKRALYPSFLRNARKAVKTIAAVGAVAASTGIMAYVYSKTDSEITGNNMLHKAVEYISQPFQKE